MIKKIVYYFLYRLKWFVMKINTLNSVFIKKCKKKNIKLIIQFLVFLCFKNLFIPRTHSCFSG